MAQAALESVDFFHKFGQDVLGFQICSPDIILATRHVSIRHTDQKRPEMEADGRWRKLPGADGRWKMAETSLESVDYPANLAHGMLGFQI